MGLGLMRWDQRGQDDPSFLVAIALTVDLLNASEGVPAQLGGILGSDGEWERHAVGVLRLLGETIRHEKDCQDTSSRWPDVISRRTRDTSPQLHAFQSGVNWTPRIVRSLTSLGVDEFHRKHGKPIPDLRHNDPSCWRTQRFVGTQLSAVRISQP
jgi:hypothetical protein